MRAPAPLRIVPLEPIAPRVEDEPSPSAVETAWSTARVRVYVTTTALREVWEAVGRGRAGETPDPRTMVERGGGLVGRYAVSLAGQPFIVITGALAAPAAPSSWSHIEIRAEDWQDIYRRLAGTPDRRLLGWYHSHPGLGVRMSFTDRQTQRRMFGADWQVGLVVDPVSGAVRFHVGAAAARPRWLAFVDDGAGSPGPEQETR